MLATALLLGFLFVAAVTDIRARKIYNWTTYPGLLAAIIASSVATWLGMDTVQGSSRQVELWGFVPLIDSLIGFAVCGIAMLICYVFFPGGVGGGDVKLIAMIGAYLGLYQGLESMLWTFVLGGCQALITLIWQNGVWTTFRRAVAAIWMTLRSGGVPSTGSGSGTQQSVSMYLSPSALVAVLIVRFQLSELLRL